MPIYDSFELTQQYLTKIDEDQKQTIEAFKYAAIVGSQLGSLTVWIKGKPRVIRGLESLRKVWKVEVHRRAHLKSRPSDADFPTGCLSQDDGADNDEKTEVDETAQQISDLKEVVASINTFIQDNKMDTTPVMARITAAKSLNATMMLLLQMTSSAAGKLEDPDNAHLTIVRIAAAEVMRLIPSEFDDVMRILDEVRIVGNLSALEGDPIAMELAKD